MANDADPPGYRNLIVWQKAIELVVSVHSLLRGFPREELYALTSQARRAAYSIPANIAEGRGRSSPKAYLNHLDIAYGSLCELENFLVIAQRLKYIDDRTLSTLIEETTEIAKMLHGLMRRLRPSDVREDEPAYDLSDELIPNA